MKSGVVLWGKAEQWVNHCRWTLWAVLSVFQVRHNCLRHSGKNTTTNKTNFQIPIYHPTSSHKPNKCPSPVPWDIPLDRTNLPFLGAIESVSRNQMPWLLASACIFLSARAGSAASLSLGRGCMDHIWQHCFQAAEQASSGLSQQLLEQHLSVPCSNPCQWLRRVDASLGFLGFLLHMILSVPEEFTNYCRMSSCDRDDDVKWVKELSELRSLFSGAQKGIKWCSLAANDAVIQSKECTTSAQLPALILVSAKLKIISNNNTAPN